MVGCDCGDLHYIGRSEPDYVAGGFIAAECHRCGSALAYVGSLCNKCDRHEDLEEENLKSKQRCGDHFLTLVARFTGIKLEDSDAERTDACRQLCYGHMIGLAEKVYLGACDAAMIAPAHADVAWTRSAHKLVADEYDLLIFEKRRNRVTELWFVRGKEAYIRLVAGIDDNIVRGDLCGIPALGIDPDYLLEKP